MCIRDRPGCAQCAAGFLISLPILFLHFRAIRHRLSVHPVPAVIHYAFPPPRAFRPRASSKRYRPCTSRTDARHSPEPPCRWSGRRSRPPSSAAAGGFPAWGRDAAFHYYVSSTPHLFDKANIAKQNFSHCSNVICDGSPSRIRMVRRISLGITTRPRSSACVK